MWCRLEESSPHGPTDPIWIQRALNRPRASKQAIDRAPGPRHGRPPSLTHIAWLQGAFSRPRIAADARFSQPRAEGCDDWKGPSRRAAWNDNPRDRTGCRSCRVPDWPNGHFRAWERATRAGRSPGETCREGHDRGPVGTPSMNREPVTPKNFDVSMPDISADMAETCTHDMDESLK